MIDSELAKEIRRLNGDNSDECRFKALRKIDAARRDLSTPDVMRTFADCIAKHGRAVVAICIAATLIDRQKRLAGWNLEWANDVLAYWTNRKATNVQRGVIHDGLHPSKIQIYAGSYIYVTGGRK